MARALDLAPEVVTALLESGQILCRYAGGEPQVPLSQLEEFFRERLVRVYAAEYESVEEVRDELVGVPEPAPLPVAVSEPAATSAPPAIDVPPPPPVISEPAAPVAVPATTTALPEQRRMPRYIPRRQLDGICDDVKFTIVQLSATGLRIRHREPLVPGTEAKMSFALMRPARSVVVRVRVVWTSLARSGEERFSISGLRVIEHAERLAAAVETLRAAHELQPERRVHPRRSDDTISSLLAGVSDEEIALVTAAMQKFAADPVEASRWYSRGRFALSDEQVRRNAPSKPRDREEVLGLWEYLDRQVELEKVAGVVAWTRGAN